MAMRNMAKKRGPRCVMFIIMMLPAMVMHMGITVWRHRSLSRDAENAFTIVAMNVATQTGQVNRRAMVQI